MTKQPTDLAVQKIPVLYTEAPRARVSIEIERMTKGPPKVSVRIDGGDSDAAADEAIRIYNRMTDVLDGE